VVRDGVILAHSEFITLKENEEVIPMTIRYRTCGDMPITGAVESDADTLDKIIEDIATTRTTERGGRADDKRAETAMEDRKKQGYF
jgi:sulfate adenylyltransferase subunit 2